jgi:hypothetical protein
MAAKMPSAAPPGHSGRRLGVGSVLPTPVGAVCFARIVAPVSSRVKPAVFDPTLPVSNPGPPQVTQYRKSPSLQTLVASLIRKSCARNAPLVRFALRRAAQQA